MLKNRAIASAKAFLNNSFDTLVQITGIEPKDDWYNWEDNEGNKLRITKIKSVLIYPAKNISQTTKDLFRKAHPSLIVRNSQWIIYLPLSNRKDSILSFIGFDGLLRCSYFKDDKWEYNFSPVLLGYNNLLSILKNCYKNNSGLITKMYKTALSKYFEIERGWFSPLPMEEANKDLRDIICHLITQDLKE